VILGLLFMLTVLGCQCTPEQADEMNTAELTAVATKVLAEYERGWDRKQSAEIVTTFVPTSPRLPGSAYYDEIFANLKTVDLQMNIGEVRVLPDGSRILAKVEETRYVEFTRGDTATTTVEMCFYFQQVDEEWKISNITEGE